MNNTFVKANSKTTMSSSASGSLPFFKGKLNKSGNIFVWLKLIAIIGVLMLAAVCCVDLSKVGNASLWNLVLNYIKSLGLLVLLAGATFMAGALVGFLFGIPKMIQMENTTGVMHNDNLVQVSDWLTKIIVGVGLTQLHQIPSGLYKLGETIQKNANNLNITVNTSVATVMYFVILGFTCSYLWTRIYFTKMLAENNRELEDINDKLRKKVEEKEKEVKAIINTFDPARRISEQKQEKEEVIKKGNIAEDFLLDPQKGKWGGKTANNDRKITAQVTETTFNKELFVVVLKVSSTNPMNPLSGEVRFHLHPTFENPDPVVKVIDGTAQIELLAYGAFTAGAECDNTKTQLEIDLATDVPSAPQLFKER